MAKSLRTEIIGVTDRSGSMSGREEAVISGWNRYMKDQRTEDGECTVTFVKFDDEIDTVFSSINIHDKRALITTEDYEPRGMTRLNDAICSTILAADARHKAMPKKERPELVIMVITTDGLENASKEFKRSDIQEAIRKHEKNNKWQFVFLGANIDAFEEGGARGFAVHNTAQYDANSNVGVQNAYFAASQKTRASRSGDFAQGTMSTENIVSDLWDEEDED